MKYLIVIILLVSLVGCGGGPAKGGNTGGDGSGGGGGTIPNLVGSWEISATSSDPSNSGSARTALLIETKLSQAGATASAHQSDIFLMKSQANGLYYHLGQWCTESEPGQNDVSITADASSNLQFTINLGGNTFTGSGKFSGSGASGTYQGTTTGCTESGTWSMAKSSSFSGKFSGWLDFPNGSHDFVSANASGNTISGTVSGDDAGTFSLDEVYIGNVATLTGTLQLNNQSPATRVLYAYYSANSATIYVFESDDTFDGTIKAIQ